MKILVPVKRVVDANIKVKVGPDGKLDVANLKHSMNPFDEIALEQAVQRKGHCQRSDRSVRRRYKVSGNIAHGPCYGCR